MRIKATLCIVALLSCLMLLLPVATPTASATTVVPRGPRAPGLIFKFYADPASAYLALKAGEIEVMLWPLEKAMYDDAIKDPDIMLAPVVELGKFQFDLNNNYTISSTAAIDPVYAKIRNPLSMRLVRQALAHMVDKDYIVSVILEGFGIRNDVPVPPPSSSWWNTSVIGANYPYPYSLIEAKRKLDLAGFVDRDGDGIRNYPVDWPGLAEAGFDPKNPPNVHPFIFYARSDHLPRLYAAEHLRDNMIACGLPVDWRPGPVLYCYHPVMGRREYHIYTGGWSVGRYPTYLYSLYHDMFYYAYGPNYVTGKNAAGEPNYPRLNEATHNFYYSKSIAEAEPWAKLAQGIIVDECITIELWSARSFYAYRNLLGVINMDSVGPENIYTYMNAYRVDDPKAPIRLGLKEAPTQINQIYSSWVWDVQVMGGFMDGTFDVQPYDILVDNPWRARDWLYWVAGGKSHKTWWYHKEIYWIEPITGAKLKKFTTEDVEFSVWYYYQTPDAWVFAAYKDIESVIRHDDYTVTLKFVAESVWLQWAGLARQLPKAAGWLKPPLTTIETRTNITADPATGYLPLPRRAIGAPVEIIECKDSTTGSPVAATIENGWIKVTPGARVDVTYRARGDAKGYHPGGLPWTETLIGTGLYYLKDIKPGIGGWAILEANRNHFLTTPLIGEFDWVYYWTGTPPTTPAAPYRKGNWKLTIYDVASVAGAYGTQGRYVPDLLWKPGADFAPSADGKPGRIDIFDVTTLTGQYGLVSMYYPDD